jgi:hypothetical protein
MHIPRVQINYASLSAKALHAAKTAALQPYVRLFVFLTTFISLFAVVLLKDDVLPALSSPEGGPSGHRAWKDLEAITQKPHPWNTRNNDVVREYILHQMQQSSSDP